MDLLGDESKQKILNKAEQELVENEKTEYKLLGTFLRRKGLNLFCYNHSKNELTKVNIEYSETLHLIPDDKGCLLPTDLELNKVMVDSRNEYFEALKYETAKKRVEKWKSGKIKQLCNLREPRKEPLKFW